MHVSIHECVHTCMRVCMHVCRRGIQVHTESPEMENMRRRNKNGSVSHGGERQRAASGERQRAAIGQRQRAASAEDQD